MYIEDVRLPVLMENIGASNSHFSESGATPTTTKSQNSTGMGQEVPTSTQCSHSSRRYIWQKWLPSIPF